MSDAGETTDDGSESPILCVSRAATCAKPVKYAIPTPAPSFLSPARGHVGKHARSEDRCDLRPEAMSDETDDTGQTGETDEGRDVFDSQGRRFYAPALKASNVMWLLKHAWFRAECDHTLRTRLPLHCRDCFDLVSKYLLALKAR
jgi:hypothetical protein